MKRIEEIEGLSESQLLDKALEESAPIPQGLKKRLEASLEADVPSIKGRLLTGAAVAAAACLAIAVLLPGTSSGELKDTFDDPYLAYAQVERAFGKISEKMSQAKEKTLQATSSFEKPISVIRKINKQ